MNSRTITTLAVVAILLAAGCRPNGTAEGQEVHPTKVEFADAETWPGTSAAEIQLPNFRPFRAVYERVYRQGLGPGAGEVRQDWVVVTADYAVWDDREAIVVSMYDQGNAIYPDTNGRIWTAYLDRENLSLFLELGPIPGTAKDYYVWRQMADGMRGGMLHMDKEESEFRNDTSKPGPGIGIGPWAMASLPLFPGKKIRLDPYYGITSNAFGATPAVVVGQVSFEDPTGTVWETWQLDQMGSLGSPSVRRTHLISEPPYMVARYSHNLETGDDSRGHRLVSFQYLEVPPTTSTTASN